MGTTIAASAGAVGSAAAVPCVAALANAEGYDSCPAPSFLRWAAEGRTGLVMDTCWDDGVEYKKVDFECSEVLWVKSSDLKSANDCFC